MIKLIIFIAIIALQIGCGKSNQSTYNTPKETKNNSKPFSPNVIYGEDNRLDLYQVNDSKLHQLSRSTVALINTKNLILNDVGEYQLTTSEYGKRYGLCSDEAFFTQKSAAFCSGFLVQEDIIITAGHCIKHQADCENTNFLFDYGYYNADQQLERFQKDQVYSCKNIIKSYQQAGDADYAVIQLDRPVQYRTPMKLALENELKINDEVFVIGHPAGLPVKYAPDGNVRRINSSYFTAGLDTYGGNSGSAVFNSNTNSVEGILVRGEMDFVFDRAGCRRSKKCAAGGCRGEDVTNIQVAKAYIPDSEVQKPSPQIFSSKNPLEILDFQSQTSDITVNTISEYVGQVYIKVDLEHTYIGDLTLILSSPGNKTYRLHYKNGYSADFIKGIYGQNLIPIDTIEGLRPQLGVWSLKIEDHHLGDSGVLHSWSVIFD